MQLSFRSLCVLLLGFVVGVPVDDACMKSLGTSLKREFHLRIPLPVTVGRARFVSAPCCPSGFFLCREQLVFQQPHVPCSPSVELWQQGQKPQTRVLFEGFTLTLHRSTTAVNLSKKAALPCLLVDRCLESNDQGWLLGHAWGHLKQSNLLCLLARATLKSTSRPWTSFCQLEWLAAFFCFCTLYKGRVGQWPVLASDFADGAHGSYQTRAR